jgi:AraC-like DNA-binding protein
VGLEGSDLPAADGQALVASGQRLAVLGEQLWLAGLSAAPGCGPLLDGLARALAGDVLRLAGGPDHGVIDTAIAHLVEHHAASQGIAALAGRLGVSAGWLHRAFRRRTGCSPRVFLEDVRLERARHLLTHGGLPVARVAHLTGFRDPLYFSRVFRRRCGLSPQAWIAAGAPAQEGATPP